MRPQWSRGPVGITLVRHAESVGNEADAVARGSRAEELELDARDADVELSETGQLQAKALSAWLSDLPPSGRPTLAISSPYRRAATTAERALEGLGIELLLDERLRERDLGIFDGLTGKGIRARYPEEAARREKLGKFYYQPPRGESWCDVVLRIRTLLQDLRDGYDGERVWLFSHQAVIMSFRYVLEGLSEAEVLDLDRTVQIPNASVTTYARRGSFLDLETFADTDAVERTSTAVTRETDQAGRGSSEPD